MWNNVCDNNIILWTIEWHMVISNVQYYELSWWYLRLSVSQGFWYFAQLRSREIQVNPRNPVKFTKTRKILQNWVKILSNRCLYNIFETYFSYCGFLLAVNLQIYLETSSLKRANNVPKLPRVDYVAKNLGTSHDVKSFAIGSFLEHIVVERANDNLCQKNVKNTGLISAKPINFKRNLPWK